MTNIVFYRRYNWHLVWRQHRQKFWLVILCILTGLMLKVGESWLLELNARLTSENAHLSLISDVWRLTHFGSPGTTAIDYAEHTQYLAELRSPD